MTSCASQVTASRAKRHRGAVLVEFALVFPLLLVCVFATVGYSVALFDKIIIANASREAARAGSRAVVDMSAGTTSYMTAAAIQTRAISLCTGLITFGASATCTATASSPNGQTKDQPLTVTVTYPYQFLAIGNPLNPLGTGVYTLSAATTMRYE